MRPTPLARGLVAAAGVLALAGFLTETVVPGAIALALCLYLLHARQAAADAFGRVDVRVRRRILDPILHEGRTFQVELDAGRCHAPRGVRLRVEDVPPPGVECRERPRVEKGGRLVYAAVSKRAGGHAFHRLRLQAEDTPGLWQATWPHSQRTSFKVLPNPRTLAAERRRAHRVSLQVRDARPVRQPTDELQFAGLRDFAPGDRVRDVDWKRTAQFRKLVTRTWESTDRASLLLLVDAGRTMRAGDGETTTKLDHAIGLACAFVTIAEQANAEVQGFVFDEDGVLEELSPARGKGALAGLVPRLESIPDALRVRRRLDAGADGEAPLDERELDFLATVRALRDNSRGAREARDGLEKALSRATRPHGHDGRTVTLLTDLETVPKRTLRSVGALAARGARVLVVLLPASGLPRTSEPPAPRDVENAYRAETTREEARRILRGYGAQVVVAGPLDGASRILEEGDRIAAGRAAR